MEITPFHYYCNNEVHDDEFYIMMMSVMTKVTKVPKVNREDNRLVRPQTSCLLLNKLNQD